MIKFLTRVLIVAMVAGGLTACSQKKKKSRSTTRDSATSMAKTNRTTGNHKDFKQGTDSTGVGQTRPDSARAETLYNNYKDEKALKLYRHQLTDHPQNVNALWHTSLLYSRLGNRFDDKDQKKTYFKKAEKKAREALDIDSDNSKANFALAVALGEMARVGNMHDKLKAASDIKKYAVQAIHADSSNAGAWFLLGSWNYKISSLGEAKQTFAHLFSHIPKGASHQKAIRDIKKAIDLHPSFTLYYYGLARAYKGMDKGDQAIEACRKAIKSPEKTPDDTEYKSKCRKIIDQLS